MVVTSTRTISETVERAVAACDFERIKREYWDQNEFVFLKGFLPREAVEEHLVPQANRLKPELNRNYIPGHKKGGSVSYYTVREKAPAFMELYRSPAFLDFLSRLVGARLMLCPENDPHSCALYYYTEPGDHIGFHYDTSYYKGARYTILVGLVDNLQRRQALACRDAAGGRRGARGPDDGVCHEPGHGAFQAALLQLEGRLRVLRRQGPLQAIILEPARGATRRLGACLLHPETASGIGTPSAR